jgi:hypothetical protein
MPSAGQVDLGVFCEGAGKAALSEFKTVTASHSYTLTLVSHDDNYPGDPTYTRFDDVAVG